MHGSGYEEHLDARKEAEVVQTSVIEASGEGRGNISCILASQLCQAVLPEAHTPLLYRHLRAFAKELVILAGAADTDWSSCAEKVHAHTSNKFNLLIPDHGILWLNHSRG